MRLSPLLLTILVKKVVVVVYSVCIKFMFNTTKIKTMSEHAFYI